MPRSTEVQTLFVGPKDAKFQLIQDQVSPILQRAVPGLRDLIQRGMLEADSFNITLVNPELSIEPTPITFQKWGNAKTCAYVDFKSIEDQSLEATTVFLTRLDPQDEGRLLDKLRVSPAFAATDPKHFDSAKNATAPTAFTVFTNPAAMNSLSIHVIIPALAMIFFDQFGLVVFA